MDKEKFYNFLKNIPKAELHLHLEALISRASASEILSRKDPKYKSIDVVNKLFSYNSLKEFINVFLLIQSSFERLKDFETLFNNISPYLKRNGIVYSEIFFAPSNFMRNGLIFEEIMDDLVKKIREIKQKDGITVKIIIDVSRTFGIDNAEHNLDLIIKNKYEDIIGIGLGGDEKKGPARDYKSVYSRAKNQSLHRVAHAGEDVGSESIWDSINYLDVERIGHGISAIKDDKLIDFLVDKQLALEVCPTSNVFTKKFVTKIENHPIKQFYKKGILVTLNTDDPAFFNVELIDEYWNLYSKLGFSMADIKQIIINGFKASFISYKDKDEYIKRVNTAWVKYQNLLN